MAKIQIPAQTTRPFGIIYLLTNKINGKFYVGQTIGSLRERIIEHIRVARNGKQTYLCNALRKYGEENFSVQVLCDCDNQNELNEKERFYIAHYGGFDNRNVMYNMKDGGVSGTPCEAIRKKQSDLLKVKYLGAGNPFYGKKHSDESKELNRKNRTGKLKGEYHPQYGWKHSEERKKKQGEIIKELYSQPYYKQLHKDINTGDRNPYAIKITVEQKDFIINLRKQGAGFNAITLLFRAKYINQHFTTCVCERVCREAAIPYPKIPIQKRHLFKLKIA